MRRRYDWLFWAVPQQALDDDRLNPSEVLILGILYTRTNADYVAWPTQRYLADRLHSSVRNVRRNLKRLEDLGWLKTEKSDRNKVNFYRMTIPDKLSAGRGRPLEGTSASSLHIEEIDKRDIAADAAGERKKKAETESREWVKADLVDYLADMLQSGNPAVRLIAEYWSAKGGVGLPGTSAPIQFGGLPEAQAAIRRNLRAANGLVKQYPWPRILATMEALAEHADFDWKLETVGKYIDYSPQKLVESLKSIRKKIYA